MRCTTAPTLRDQSKALHKAREALHDLSHSVPFNNESAMTLAQTLGNAESQLAFLRTKMKHDIFAVLSPEQQARMLERLPETEPGRGREQGDGPPPRP